MGKNSDPTLFQGLLVQNRNLVQDSHKWKRPKNHVNHILFRGTNWLTVAYAKQGSPHQGWGEGCLKLITSPFWKKKIYIYRFTLMRLSYLSRSLRSSLSFSSSSCFALEIYSSSVFMLSSDRELKYFFLNRIKIAICNVCCIIIYA